MGKFKFYQDKEIKTWVRDYFNVEAESLEDAIEYVKKMGCLLEVEERKKGTKVEFITRDWDWMYDALCDVSDDQNPMSYGIYSCDLENDGAMDSEVFFRDNYISISHA